LIETLSKIERITSIYFTTQYFLRGYGRCASENLQMCNPPRRLDDAPDPISEGAGVGFNQGLQLHSWSMFDYIIEGAILNSKATVSWLFVPPSPKLFTPVTGLTAEVLKSSSAVSSY
jgi:hypothetical protein